MPAPYDLIPYEIPRDLLALFYFHPLLLALVRERAELAHKKMDEALRRRQRDRGVAPKPEVPKQGFYVLLNATGRARAEPNLGELEHEAMMASNGVPLNLSLLITLYQEALGTRWETPNVVEVGKTPPWEAVDGAQWQLVCAYMHNDPIVGQRMKDQALLILRTAARQITGSFESIDAFIDAEPSVIRERLSYVGEGFVFLYKITEKLLNEPRLPLAQQRVLASLAVNIGITLDKVPRKYIDDRLSILMVRLAELNLSESDFDSAESWCTEALRLTPTFSPGRTVLQNIAAARAAAPPPPPGFLYSEPEEPEGRRYVRRTRGECFATPDFGVTSLPPYFVSHEPPTAQELEELAKDSVYYKRLSMARKDLDYGTRVLRQEVLTKEEVVKAVTKLANVVRDFTDFRIVATNETCTLMGTLAWGKLSFIPKQHIGMLRIAFPYGPAPQMGQLVSELPTKYPSTTNHDAYRLRIIHSQLAFGCSVMQGQSITPLMGGVSTGLRIEDTDDTHYSVVDYKYLAATMYGRVSFEGTEDRYRMAAKRAKELFTEFLEDALAMGHRRVGFTYYALAALTSDDAEARRLLKAGDDFEAKQPMYFRRDWSHFRPIVAARFGLVDEVYGGAAIAPDDCPSPASWLPTDPPSAALRKRQARAIAASADACVQPRAPLTGAQEPSRYEMVRAALADGFSFRSPEAGQALLSEVYKWPADSCFDGHYLRLVIVSEVCRGAVNRYVVEDAAREAIRMTVVGLTRAQEAKLVIGRYIVVSFPYVRGGPGPNSVLHLERPDIELAISDTVHPLCYGCLRLIRDGTETAFVCPSCDDARFCSVSCQEQGRTDFGHAAVCK
jgi:hypothetical protein